MTTQPSLFPDTFTVETLTVPPASTRWNDPEISHFFALLENETRAGRTGDDMKVHGQFTRGQLSEAFDRIKDPVHWKRPIYALIDPEDRDLMAAAVDWFTSTQASFEPLPSGRLCLRSIGYQAGPAGDH